MEQQIFYCEDLTLTTDTDSLKEGHVTRVQLIAVTKYGAPIRVTAKAHFLLAATGGKTLVWEQPQSWYGDNLSQLDPDYCIEDLTDTFAVSEYLGAYLQ